jgi:uncharacterized tellurite resistance protein B-like protein
MTEKLIQSLKSAADILEVSLAEANDYDIQTIVAILLVEIGKADGEYTLDEQRELMSVLAREFELPNEESSHIMEVADFLSSDSSAKESLYKKLEESLGENQRIKLINFLCQMIFADGEVKQLEVDKVKSLAFKLGASEEELLAAVKLAEEQNSSREQ